MIYRKFAGLCVLAIAATACPAMADTFTPSHSCIQPVKPAQFRNNQEVAMFNNAVSEYKQCISAFVEEHYAIASSHQNAADDAIDEWNNFLSDNDLN